MFLRALALLILMLTISAGLSWWFGAEVLAALGLILAQGKILIAKGLSLSSGALLGWLKAQGINFARVELAKRWFLRSALPLLIGAATQRRIVQAVATARAAVRARYDGLMGWYGALPRSVRVLTVLTAITATLALALATVSLWLLVFTVQVPFWILAALATFWQVIWRTAQKLVFRTIAFMQLYRVWGVIRRRIPEPYMQRKRRFDYRLARIVVRRRRLTTAQLHAQKHGLAMRLALIAEYFRHARPAQPSAAEMRRMRARRAERKEQ